MKVILGLIMLVSANAFAYESTSTYDRVEVECRGYVDKFSIFLTSDFAPNDVAHAVTSLEVGYVLKTWQPTDETQWDDVKVVAGDVTIEGLVGAGQGKYNYSLPEGYSWDGSQSHFSTGLKIKTGYVNGNVTLNCTGTIRKTKRIQKSEGY